MDPEALGQALKGLPPVLDPNVLIGAATADDAAVYKISDELAIVATVDFFTPIVDDARLFGRIAATNALSDIYAMGARPVFALNLAAFPAKTLPIDVLQEILAGGAEVAQSAGVSLLGGHTIEDEEPKYGLCAIGLAHPDAIWPNAAGVPGDALVLTKGLGTGIITTAMKADAAPEPAIQAAIAAMTTTNRKAAEIAASIGGVHACTDVTGFGLLGHLREMALGAGLSARLEVRQVPLLRGARELAEADFAPGGSERNLAFVRPGLLGVEALSPVELILMADAQTAGGLLFALPIEQARALVAALHEAGIGEAAIIGALCEGAAGTIRLEV